ncbi:bile acid:sodium symporter family protein [Gordonia sp. HNM0687]|uniref:Bile acid:sodium symporter family protein n=1 Tax=Gordonia mangrovi TaxID=2665643 RepID=A0A6L7GUB6_9ACTN|nr:bile acid:sodium symporter family protein [Gordonia mangrovi]MXP23536.1 bile acid:sodium symporter family protein [Gordonia mangrovi]UVF76569.1 bile acid:sodium symporter family protein [Gordonia mangrovi]
MIVQSIAASDIDSVEFTLSPALSLLMKVLIAFILFGVALDSRPSDFRNVLRRPIALAATLGTQYVLMPAVTLGVIAIMNPNPTVALGILFVACCPSGTLSNLFTHRSHGNVTMSVSLTTVSSALCVVLTPLSFALWGGMSSDVSALLEDIQISISDMLVEVGIMIAVPFALGMLVARRYPGFALAARKPVDIATLVVLLMIAVGGFAGQASALITGLSAVLGVVLVQNVLSLSIGYGVARACRLPVADARAVAFESGVRNSALSLALVLMYFEGFGGAALAAAYWGIVDTITGLALAEVWRRRPLSKRQAADDGVPTAVTS